MTSWDNMTEVEQLQCTFSDLYKEVNGFRPRFASDEQWNSAEWLREQIKNLCDEEDAYYNENMKTFAGRETLRAEGCVVPEETDPELARMAKWLAEERQRDYTDNVAGADYDYKEDF